MIPVTWHPTNNGQKRVFKLTNKVEKVIFNQSMLLNWTPVIITPNLYKNAYIITKVRGLVIYAPNINQEFHPVALTACNKSGPLQSQWHIT